MNLWLLLGLAAGGLLVVALAILNIWLLQKLRGMRQAQMRLLQQLDGVHGAQVAYAEATEGALSHLRDGLQSLTTVCANLDMKTYALELRQVQTQRRSQAPAPSENSTHPYIPVSPPPEVASPLGRPLSAAEAQLLQAVRNPAGGPRSGAPS